MQEFGAGRRGGGMICTEHIRISGRVSGSKRKDGELHDDSSSSSFGDRKRPEKATKIPVHVQKQQQQHIIPNLQPVQKSNE